MKRPAPLDIGPLACLLLVALLVRAAAAVWWHTHSGEGFAFGDTASYWALGQALADGRPYVYGTAHIFRMPGYPLLLAGLMRLVGNHDDALLWARALNVLLGVAAVAAVYALARMLSNRRTAMIAAAVACFYPGAVAMSIILLSEALFGPLMLVHLGAWAAAFNSPATRRGVAWAAMAGGLGGAATLVRPEWLLFTPLALAASMAFGPRRGRTATIAAPMLVALVAVMSPWWIRNAQLTGHFVPTTLQVGASLYDGLNPRADGSSNMDFVGRQETELRSEMPAASPVELEYALDVRLRRAALSWAAEHPGRVLCLAGIKLVHMWNVWPNEPKFRRAWLGLALLVGYGPVLLLAGYGWFRVRAWRTPLLLYWLPAFYLTGLHVVFVSSIRYRQPAMFGLIVLAAAGIDRWWSRDRV